MATKQTPDPDAPQYAGWRQLPGGDGVKAVVPTAFAGPLGAAGWLMSRSSGPVPFRFGDHAQIDARYRAAALKLHPDKGGTPAEWQRLQDAVAMLRKGTT